MTRFRLAAPIGAALLVLGAAGAPPRAHAQAATAAALAPSARDRWADSARRAIEAASAVGDRAALANVRALVGRALALSPGDALLLHYLGYAHYREALAALAARDTPGARTHLEAADTLLARSGERLPMAETFALRSAALGMLIGTGNPLAAMTLGPKAGAAMDRAVALGPRNPRVALLRGTGAFNTPAMWGGGMDRAQRYLEQAVALYAGDRPSPPMPAWGEGEAHLWLGRVRQRAGDTAGARAAYARALALQPDNRWLTRVLIPALDRPAPGTAPAGGAR